MRKSLTAAALGSALIALSLHADTVVEEIIARVTTRSSPAPNTFAAKTKLKQEVPAAGPGQCRKSSLKSRKMSCAI